MAHIRMGLDPVDHRLEGILALRGATKIMIANSLRHGSIERA
jgi:hypothetical protein